MQLKHLAPASRTAVSLLILLAASLPAGCGGNGGGGVSTGTPPGPVALPAQACDPSQVNEGCALGAGVSARLRCHPGIGTWELVEQCASDKTCTWLADPADPTGQKKLTSCGQIGGFDAVGGSDGGTATSDSDAGTGAKGDALGGEADAGALEDSIADTWTPGPDLCGNAECDGDETETSCALDCDKDVAAEFKCIAGKCDETYVKCMDNDGCRKLIKCIAACKDEVCIGGCAKGISGGTAKLYQGLGACIAKANCDNTPPPTKCGDLKCEGDENEQTCPSDCKKGPVCGDGNCEGTENADNCAVDCKQQVKCGDLVCVAPQETQISCALDCDAQTKEAATCLKLKCEPKLDACTNEAYCMIGLLCAYQCPIGDQNCLQDCGKKTGSGQMLFNSLTSCALLNDCKLGAPAKCGNAKCEQGENKANCEQDCGACATACANLECGTVKDCPGKVCGGCGAAKKCENNICVVGDPTCGDGSCDGVETPQSCAQDCAGATTVCGNGKCEANETAQSCPKDCTTQSQCDCKAKGAQCGILAGCSQSCGTCAANQKCQSLQCVAASTCGNKQCEAPYENASNCPLDCQTKTDCNTSCQGRCGKYTGGCKCQCDAACTNYNDCCPDKKQLCG